MLTNTGFQDGPGNQKSDGIAELDSVSQIGDNPLDFSLLYFQNIQSVGALTKSFQKIIDEQRRAIESIEKQLVQRNRLSLIGRISTELAHEIRNPIYGVKSTLELLSSKFPEQDVHHHLIHLSLAELDRVIELICQMLDWRQDSNESFTRIDLSKLLEDISDFVQPLFSRRNIQLIRQLDKNIPPIWGMPNQLKQVLFNLFFNAMDAVEEGGEIRFVAFKKGIYIIMKVVDNGKGISPAIQEKLFDPFFTTKISKNRAGLGLSIVRKIIKKHKGKIVIESKPDLGTAVSVIFPIEIENVQKYV